MSDKNDASDESWFNDTLKRMLRTPPKPHEKVAKDKPVNEPAKSAKNG